MAFKPWIGAAALCLALPLGAATVVQTSASDFNLGSGDGQVEVTSVSGGEVHLMRAAGALGAWSSATALPVATSNVCGWSQGNRIVMAGGYTCTGIGVSTVVSADVSGGVLGPWTTQAPLPAIAIGSGVARWGNFLYLAQANSSNTLASSTVWMTQLDATGLPGAWTTVTSLPLADPAAGLLADYGRLYYFQAEGYSNQVYSAPILQDGTLGAWTLEGSHRIQPLAYYWLASAMGTFFSFGGETSADFYSGESAVDRAPLSSAGVLGSFVAQASLPQPRAYSSRVQVGLDGHLYIAGGKTGDPAVAHNTVYSAPLSAGGVMGAWGTESALPQNLYTGIVLMAGGELFYLGADDPTVGCYTSVYQAPLNQGSANCAQGVYDNRFDLGSDQALNQLTWALQPSNGGSMQARWCSSAGSYGAWSSPNSSGALDLGGNTARYVEYRMLLSDVPGSDVYLQSVTLEYGDAPTATPTATPTVTPVQSPTNSPVQTSTASPTGTFTASPVATATPSPAATSTASPTPVPTLSATHSPVPLPSMPADPGDPVCYPNPGRGPDIHFGFRSDHGGRCVLRVWNSAGQLASTSQNSLVSGKQVIDLHIKDYAAGVYLYQLELDNDDGSVLNGPLKRFAVVR